MMERFGSVASLFRYFDMRQVGSVTFCDFCFGMDQIGIGLSKDVVLQIFTYLDGNRDNLLKYNDFCLLVNLSSN